MTKVKLNTQEVLKSYQNGDYNAPESTAPKLKKLQDTHIEDENKSVKWNKEFVQQNNEAYTQRIVAERKARNEGIQRLEIDLVQAIANEYDVLREEADVIYSYAYREHHSSGFHDVVSAVDEVVDLVRKIKEINGL